MVLKNNTKNVICLRAVGYTTLRVKPGLNTFKHFSIAPYSNNAEVANALADKSLVVMTSKHAEKKAKKAKKAKKTTKKGNK